MLECDRTGTRKFDRGLSQILHDELHWLDVPDRVFFKLAVLVHRCLNGRAPSYLLDYCVPVASAATRRHLRSANRQLLAVPRYRLNTYGRCAFSHRRPHSLELSPGTRPSGVSDVCLNVFVRSIPVHSARQRFLTITALYKSTYLLTYNSSNNNTLHCISIQTHNSAT